MLSRTKNSNRLFCDSVKIPNNRILVAVLAFTNRPSIAIDWRSIAIDCHRLPSIAIDCHRLPSIAIDLSRRASPEQVSNEICRPERSISREPIGKFWQTAPPPFAKRVRGHQRRLAVDQWPVSRVWVPHPGPGGRYLVVVPCHRVLPRAGPASATAAFLRRTREALRGLGRGSGCSTRTPCRVVRDEPTVSRQTSHGVRALTGTRLTRLVSLYTTQTRTPVLPYRQARPCQPRGAGQLSSGRRARRARRVHS